MAKLSQKKVSGQVQKKVSGNSLGDEQREDQDQSSGSLIPLMQLLTEKGEFACTFSPTEISQSQGHC